MRNALLVAGLAVALAGSATGEVYVITPDGTGDYPTIQQAIIACVDGDIVELTDGVFSGEENWSLDFLGRAITLRSQSGAPQACVLDVAGSEAQQRWGIQFMSGEGPNSRVEDLTICRGCDLGC